MKKLRNSRAMAPWGMVSLIRVEEKEVGKQRNSFEEGER